MEAVIRPVVRTVGDLTYASQQRRGGHQCHGWHWGIYNNALYLAAGSSLNALALAAFGLSTSGIIFGGITADVCNKFIVNKSTDWGLGSTVALRGAVSGAAAS